MILSNCFGLFILWWCSKLRVLNLPSIYLLFALVLLTWMPRHLVWLQIRLNYVCTIIVLANDWLMMCCSCLIILTKGLLHKLILNANCFIIDFFLLFGKTSRNTCHFLFNIDFKFSCFTDGEHINIKFKHLVIELKTAIRLNDFPNAS